MGAETDISTCRLATSLVEKVQLQGRPSQVKFAVSIPNSGTFFLLLLIRSKTLEPQRVHTTKFPTKRLKSGPRPWNHRSSHYIFSNQMVILKQHSQSDKLPFQGNIWKTKSDGTGEPTNSVRNNYRSKTFRSPKINTTNISGNSLKLDSFESLVLNHMSSQGQHYKILKQ